VDIKTTDHQINGGIAQTRFERITLWVANEHVYDRTSPTGLERVMQVLQDPKYGLNEEECKLIGCAYATEFELHEKKDQRFDT